MFALQSAAPDLGPRVALVLVLAVVGGGLGALGSALVRRLSNPVGKYRLLYGVVFVAYALVAYVLLSLFGVGSAVAGAVGLDPRGVAGVFLGTLVELLAGGTVWLAAYAPTVRDVREVRDVDLSTGRAVARVARYVVGVCVAVSVALVPLQVGPAGVAPLLAVAVLAAVGVTLVAASPWVLAALRDAREPTGETADRIAALRDAAGLDVRDVRVVETDDAETAYALVRGPPGYRRLFVSTTFLERFDDDAAAALLAVRAGRLGSRLLAVRLVTVVVGGVLAVGAVSPVGPFWLLLALSLLAVVAGLWASRRGVCVADDAAARRVGAGPVADALERYAEVHGVEPGRRRVPNPLSPNVALGDRIDRLRAASEGEGVTSEGDAVSSDGDGAEAASGEDG